jgi:hypothetical protein
VGAEPGNIATMQIKACPDQDLVDTIRELVFLLEHVEQHPEVNDAELCKDTIRDLAIALELSAYRNAHPRPADVFEIMSGTGHIDV